MSKPMILILSGLVFFLIMAGVLYYLSIPVFHLSTFKDNPDAQKIINKIIWLVVIGGAAMGTAGFLRLIYEILFGRRRKK